MTARAAGLTVLMNAGPWLPVPPRWYGGIEAVVATLVAELRRAGHRVVLATVRDSDIDCDRRIWAFEHGQFEHLASPYNRMMGIAHAHMQRVVAELARDPTIDVVHDHLEVVGPSVLAAMGASAPPVLQTLHWNLRKHPHFYGALDGGGRVYFNALSSGQLAGAPDALKRRVLGVVPLGIPVENYPLVDHKDNYFVTLARLTPDKGQDTAARVCRARGMRLVMAGPVGASPSPQALAAALSDAHSPLHGAADVRFYRDLVQPLENGLVRWIGAVAGRRKIELLSRARAALFPVRWDEPGGTAVIEALACGTPVVATRRGAMPQLVDHGVTGFLADDERELGAWLERVGEIDPARCRAAAEQRFSAATMAERYAALYAEVISKTA